MTVADARMEGLLRELAPQVLAAVVRRYHDFAAAEDAVQEALLAAAQQWPATGVPDQARGWLIRVAGRRMVDQLRSDTARRRREEQATLQATAGEPLAPPADDDRSTDRDDTLILLLLCCHPALTPASAIALTLRAVGGLRTAEIARAFLVPEPTMAQRISRAKQRIRATGSQFRLPAPDLRAARLRQVLHVLYLLFNEGYAASAGDQLHRVDLTTEAIRLARLLHRLLPEESEITGLLALMLLTEARQPARTDPDGALVPLAEQRRDRWDQAMIEEGRALLSSALGRTPPGPFQVQAAIAALHSEARHATQTDWPQILALYDVLARISPGPVVRLNRAVAVAMVHGPQAGLQLLDALNGDQRMAHTHRVDAIRGHLLERADEPGGAEAAYRRAAAHTDNLAERRYLLARAAGLAASAPRGGEPPSVSPQQPPPAPPRRSSASPAWPASPGPPVPGPDR